MTAKPSQCTPPNLTTDDFNMIIYAVNEMRNRRHTQAGEQTDPDIRAIFTEDAEDYTRLLNKLKG